MITKYFSSVVVKFDPFASSARSTRLFLSRVPSSTKIKCTILTKNDASTPMIEVTYMDKVVLSANPAAMNIKGIADHFDSHSRKLVLKDAIKN